MVCGSLCRGSPSGLLTKEFAEVAPGSPAIPALEAGERRASGGCPARRSVFGVAIGPGSGLAGRLHGFRGLTRFLRVPELGRCPTRGVPATYSRSGKEVCSISQRVSPDLQHTGSWTDKYFFWDSDLSFNDQIAPDPHKGFRIKKRLLKQNGYFRFPCPRIQVVLLNKSLSPTRPGWVRRKML